MVEIVVPELDEMRIAHIVSIGSETQCSLNHDIEDGYVSLTFFEKYTNRSTILFNNVEYSSCESLTT